MRSGMVSFLIFSMNTVENVLLFFVPVYDYIRATKKTERFVRGHFKKDTLGFHPMICAKPEVQIFALNDFGIFHRMMFGIRNIRRNSVKLVSFVVLHTATHPACPQYFNGSRSSNVLPSV